MSIQEIIEAIDSLTVVELNELVEDLQEKYGVSAAAPMMMAGPAVGGDAGAGEAAAEEKSEFDVELTDVGSAKIQVIKVVREVTGLGLKEAKEIVDNAPGMIKEGVAKEEAEEIKSKIEEAGGSVELK